MMYPTSKKWITTKDGYSVSFVHVSRPEKEIVCFPSQIGCKVGCLFCISSTQPFIRSLSSIEILRGISLFSIPTHKQILYSCMGQGEPFNNLQNVLECFKSLNGRYALSTALPTLDGISLLHTSKLEVKVQASFSAGNDLSSLRWYGGTKELNVILTEGVDISKAIKMAKFIGAKTTKLTTFNNWVGCKIKPMQMVIEMYETDGVDLGASCGQQDYSINLKEIQYAD